VHTHRGVKGTKAMGVLTSFAGTAVHDGWFPYRMFDVTHALCNAHHLRELAAVGERDCTQTWAAELADLLTAANRDVIAARASGRTALTRRRLTRLHARYDELIAAGRAANPPPPRTGKRGRIPLGKNGALIRRLDIQRQDVLRFTTDFDVPFTNNQAERDLRMAKLQMKISGCWRTDTGAATFAALRSYVSTVRKHRASVIDAITALVEGNPWLPAHA